MNIRQHDVDTTGGAFDSAAALRGEPGVETAQPQLARQRAKRLVPNDPLFSSQWHLRDTNSGSGIFGIDVKSVWDTRRGNGIRIGIIDDGIQTALKRHLRGDWGDLDKDDKTENELSLEKGFRLLSAYKGANGTKFWIITEADRSYTTVLLPSDY